MLAIVFAVISERSSTVGVVNEPNATDTAHCESVVSANKLVLVWPGDAAHSAEICLSLNATIRCEFEAE
jgi:hypothetical protein